MQTGKMKRLARALRRVAIDTAKLVSSFFFVVAFLCWLPPMSFLVAAGLAEEFGPWGWMYAVVNVLSFVGVWVYDAWVDEGELR